MTQFAVEFWQADLIVTGKALISTLVFLIMFMLMGRFRMAFVTSLFFVYYVMMFQNKDFIDRSLSIQGSTAVFIGSGALFLGLAVWAFFIESE